MNVDELVRDALREQAAGPMPLPSGFADRVLAVRRRRRNRTIAGAAAVTALAVGLSVPALSGGGEDVRPASEMNKSDIIAHPHQSPPRDMIAAGDTALAAFYVRENDKQSNGDVISKRVYGLLDQKTGKYRKTRWAFLDVAPGMRTAAVLEDELPARRIGLLDMITGKVDRWIPVEHGVAGVAFSSDGEKLVATTYSKNPDRNFADHPQNINGKDVPGPLPSRTGFSVVDVDSGKEDWHRAPYWKDETGWSANARDDFEFSHDDQYVYADIPMDPGREYYDLEGNKTGIPAAEKHVSWAEAGLSPDGKLVGGDFAGDGDEISSEIVDSRTGKRITTVPGQQLLAWADNKRLIAWGCDPERCNGKNEFRNQLLLITIGSDKVVQLSDFRKASDDYPGRWVPLFTERRS
ncbi:WD40 repeat domain-containing protein [Streptomyces spongiae]|uniref:WD40 repeat domain-containing protein n=1 Tax=Streptomyces spongiae TaxID=565072 RepID=A0A5N8XXA7_9ACTN|nr:WD40 repeat domain-containing protein [Streptomyces spongiae]MPY64004.1 WD40 repeat domain-containing protein [Streptomyces spongiae]